MYGLRFDVLHELYERSNNRPSERSIISLSAVGDLRDRRYTIEHHPIYDGQTAKASIDRKGKKKKRKCRENVSSLYICIYKARNISRIINKYEDRDGGGALRHPFTIISLR